MRCLSAPILMALSAAAVSAQPDTKFYLPSPLGNYEGDSFNDRIFNRPYIRWQQAVTDSGTLAHPITCLRLRRDGTEDTPLATSRMVEIRIVLGLKNPRTPPALTAPLTTNFAANYYAPGGQSTAMEVLARTRINLPNWSQLPASTPAPFAGNGNPIPGLAIPVGFFNYSGSPELVMEMEVWNASPAGHTVDATAGDGTLLSSSTSTGAGCGTFQHSFDFAVQSWGPRTDMTIGVQNGPPASSVLFLLGQAQANLPLGGVCGPLRTVLTNASLIGTTNGSGAFSKTTTLHVPRLFGGARLFTQCAGFNAQQSRVELTNGLETFTPIRPLPLGPTGPEGFLIEHIWSTDPTGAVVNGPFQGGLIWELQDFGLCPP